MIDSVATELLWTEKYRPQKVSDAILPAKIQEVFSQFVKKGHVPNLLLTGSPGSGKTTSALAMLKEIGSDYLFIDGSKDNGVDTLRYEITNFASAVSFAGGRKYVIVDEADYLTPNAQAAFRTAIEKYSSNCGFIFTCNYPRKIIPALSASRLKIVDFTIENSEKPRVAMEFFQRVKAILDQENIEYVPKVVAKVIEKFFPDLRRVLVELEHYAATGKIDEGIFSEFQRESVDQLFRMLKNDEFTEMRGWVAAHSNQDYAEIYRAIYETGLTAVPMPSMAVFVVTVAKYQYQHAFVADPELNLVACLTELMAEVDF